MAGLISLSLRSEWVAVGVAAMAAVGTGIWPLRLMDTNDQEGNGETQSAGCDSPRGDNAGKALRFVGTSPQTSGTSNSSPPASSSSAWRPTFKSKSRVMTGLLRGWTQTSRPANGECQPCGRKEGLLKELTYALFGTREHAYSMRDIERTIYDRNLELPESAKILMPDEARL